MATHITTLDGTSTICGLDPATLDAGDYRTAANAPTAGDCQTCADALKAAIAAEPDIQASKRVGATTLVRELASVIWNDSRAAVKRMSWSALSAGVNNARQWWLNRWAMVIAMSNWKARALAAAVIASFAAWHSVPSVRDALARNCVADTETSICVDIIDPSVAITSMILGDFHAFLIVAFTLAYFCLILFAAAPIWQLLKSSRAFRAIVIAFCVAYVSEPFVLDWLIGDRAGNIPSDELDAYVEEVQDGLTGILTLAYFCLIIFGAPLTWRLLKALSRRARQVETGR